LGLSVHPDHIMPLPRLPDYWPPDRSRTSSFIASGDVKERAMKHYIFAGLAAVLTAGALVGSAPQANAGCQYGAIAVSKCDGPIQPDGTWQRCVIFTSINNGSSSYLSTDKGCDQMGPDLRPWGLAFNAPPTRIDD
jgi:hypothetical protein